MNGPPPETRHPGRAQARPARVLPAALALACGLAAACQRAPEPGPAPAAATPPPVSPTARMAQRLESLNARTTAEMNPFNSPAVVAALRARLAATQDPLDRLAVRFQLATHLINAGDVTAAIAEIVSLQATPAQQAAAMGAEFAAGLQDLLALAHLRQGEQANCVAHRTSESCIMPVRGTGVHAAQEGSRAAIEQYSALLRRMPGFLAGRWLLNIAYMTIGEYPQGVPPEWLIPESTFRSEADVPRFSDVAQAAGAASLGLSGGAVMEDFDGDGLLDLMTSSYGLRDPLRLYRSRGDGTFEERASAAGLDGLVSGLNLVTGDVDNDGDVDVFVPRGAWLREGGKIPNSLLRNDGRGNFEDVTEQAGLLAFHPTQVASFADYDGDGWLDLFVGNESDEKTGRHPSELYRGRGDGTFANVSQLLGDPDLGYVKGADWGDINNDGRPDLFVSVLGGPNRLFRNDGPAEGGRGWTFTDIGAAAGVTAPRFSFACWFWDFDNDGWQDLFVNGFLAGSPGHTAALYLGLPNDAEVGRLFRNRGDGTFEDVTVASRLGRVAVVMGANYGDMDGDGWLDCYLGTGDPDLRTVVPNRMFRNDGGKVFQDVTTAGGFGHLQKGHGVAFGDVDGDGDQDIYQNIGGAVTADIGHTVLFENPGNPNAWITLACEGRTSNRCALGTRIRAAVRTPRGRRDIHVTVDTGGSFGASSLRQEIGLGDATAIEEIAVTWPATGRVQVFRDVPLRRAFRVVEDEADLIPLTLPTFRFRAAPPG